MILRCSILYREKERGGREFFCCEIFNIGSIDFLCWEHVGCIGVHWEEGGKLHLIPPSLPSFKRFPSLSWPQRRPSFNSWKVAAHVTYWQLHWYWLHHWKLEAGSLWQPFISNTIQLLSMFICYWYSTAAPSIDIKVDSRTPEPNLPLLTKTISFFENPIELGGRGAVQFSLRK